MNSIDVEGTDRRRPVAARPIERKAASADGDVSELHNELVTPEDRKRLTLRVDPDPSIACRVAGTRMIV